MAETAPVLLADATISSWPAPDRRGSVLVRDGRIASVIDAGSSLPRDVQRVDLDGLRISPGFIDIQINGGHGVDLTSRPDRVTELARELPQYGVTAFLPTVISSAGASYERAADHIDAAARRPAVDGAARVLGLHFEGPLINPARRGAHRAEHVATTDTIDTSWWSRERSVRLVTLAPEVVGPELITDLVERGVVVAAGHSAATYEELAAAVDAGVTHVTHLFNAMGPFSHRAPGMVGGALSGPRLHASLIVDGVHLHPAAVRLAWAALGPDRLILITDAIAALGLGSGTFDLGPVAVDVADGAVRNGDGSLAGSVLTLDQAVRNLVDQTGCEPSEALASATSTPAALLDESALGRIRPGAKADLVVLDDELRVLATIIEGSFVYVDRAQRLERGSTWR